MLNRGGLLRHVPGCRGGPAAARAADGDVARPAGQSVLGIGYAAPYLRLWREQAARCIALTPAQIGAARWPAGAPNLSCTAEEDALPFADLTFDRVLLVHGLEAAENARRLLREIWRVLKDDGRLLVVAPNRSGMWAYGESTPFGHGQPYSPGQIGRLLAASLFRVERRDTALYLPPRLAAGAAQRPAAASGPGGNAARLRRRDDHRGREGPLRRDARGSGAATAPGAGRSGIVFLSATASWSCRTTARTIPCRWCSAPAATTPCCARPIPASMRSAYPMVAKGGPLPSLTFRWSWLASTVPMPTSSVSAGPLLYRCGDGSLAACVRALLFAKRLHLDPGQGIWTRKQDMNSEQMIMSSECGEHHYLCA